MPFKQTPTCRYECHCTIKTINLNLKQIQKTYVLLGSLKNSLVLLSTQIEVKLIDKHIQMYSKFYLKKIIYVGTFQPHVPTG